MRILIKPSSRQVRGPVLLMLMLLANFFSSAAEPGTRTSVGSQDQPREIVLKTPGLMYDQPRFKVNPGETVKITLENIDEMSHNLVITKPGAREKVVALALQLLNEADQRDFIPQTDLVVNYIPMLEPGEKKSILFTAPAKEGVFPFVCTFPGHGAVMYGAIYVTAGAMPPLEEDKNIPSRHNTAHADHAGGARLPAMYRTFMPNCGPAGIAVGMEGDLSYCWDAAQCRLRYAWKGGFISLEKNWASNGSKKAEILGSVFFTDTVKAPIRIGQKDHIPKARFKGYTMVAGYPTFHYELDGVAVSERITPAAEPNSLERELVFSGPVPSLWYLVSDRQSQVIDAPGAWDGDYFKIRADGQETVLTIVIKDNQKNEK